MTRKLPRNLRGIFPGEHGLYALPRFRATGEWRPPRRGDYFLSGAIITAYYHKVPIGTPAMTQEYWIAERVEMAECSMCKGNGRVAKCG